MPSNIILIAPPATEESDLNVDKMSTRIFVQLIEHSVKDVLDSNILNAIPSWWKNIANT